MPKRYICSTESFPKYHNLATLEEGTLCNCTEERKEDCLLSLPAGRARSDPLRLLSRPFSLCLQGGDQKLWALSVCLKLVSLLTVRGRGRLSLSLLLVLLETCYILAVRSSPLFLLALSRPHSLSFSLTHNTTTAFLPLPPFCLVQPARFGRATRSVTVWSDPVVGAKEHNLVTLI